MQRLEVSGAVRPLYGSLGVKGLRTKIIITVTANWSFLGTSLEGSEVDGVRDYFLARNFPFSVPRNVRIGSAAHPASYSVITVFLLWKANWPAR